MLRCFSFPWKLFTTVFLYSKTSSAIALGLESGLRSVWCFIFTTKHQKHWVLQKRRRRVICVLSVCVPAPPAACYTPWMDWCRFGPRSLGMGCGPDDRFSTGRLHLFCHHDTTVHNRMISVPAPMLEPGLWKKSPVNKHLHCKKHFRLSSKLTIAVLQNSGVFDEGHLSSIFDQTPKEAEFHVDSGYFCMWEQTSRQYELPECSFVAVVQLLVAHLTLVLAQTISLTQLAQRWRVAGRCCSWHAAGIEEICHSCWCKQTLMDLNVRMDNVQFCAGYVPHPLGCCSPSQTCNLGPWGILWA